MVDTELHKKGGISLVFVRKFGAMTSSVDVGGAGNLILIASGCQCVHKGVISITLRRGFTSIVHYCGSEIEERFYLYGQSKWTIMTYIADAGSLFYAYPNFQKFSRFFLLSSSTNSCTGRSVTLCPCISATSPLTSGSCISRLTPSTKVSIGVTIILSNRDLSGAMLVTGNISRKSQPSEYTTHTT